MYVLKDTSRSARQTAGDAISRRRGNISTLVTLLIVALTHPARAGEPALQEQPPVYIAFLWHMHQPVYYPGETLLETEAAHHFSFSVQQVHTDRVGPYTTWPKQAIDRLAASGLGEAGAQVSLSGSLIENLDNLEAGGLTQFAGWKTPWVAGSSMVTSGGNSRLSLVSFGFYHPLMGLVGSEEICRQIVVHRRILENRLGVVPSRGMFPPENAFSERMIPALAVSGIKWVLVDNAHFDRACAGFPWSSGGGVVEPNRADVRNPDPGDWKQLTGLWMPMKASARWGRVPHWAEYVDPATGRCSRLIVVPADRYMGNEDGRGGFGALQYEAVMSQLEEDNTDPAHPILIVLAHDGDNHGGGSDAYYNVNFQNFVNWLAANPARFRCTTIQDYLDRFPPDPADVIHVEDGSWLGADAGDPMFQKWNGEPGPDLYSPDRNSWGILTAAANIVATAEACDPASSDTERAWKFLLTAQSSDYWYWDGTEVWDSNPARAANLAVEPARRVIAGRPDRTPPTIFAPQRSPYNPGATEWGVLQREDFRVWTYVFDVSGLSQVRLRYRTNPSRALTSESFLYAPSNELGPWVELPMAGQWSSSRTDPSPLEKAKEYSATVTGLSRALLDYYVEAVDSAGNMARSPILHVYVGDGSGGETGVVQWSPLVPTNNDTVTISVRSTMPASLHWGVNQWELPHLSYWPAGSVAWGDGRAIESPFGGLDSSQRRSIRLGPFNNPAQVPSKLAFVIHYSDNSWDNNSGRDYFVTLQQPTLVRAEQDAPPVSRLVGSWPNPFNPITTIGIELARPADVRLGVYDLLGREVARLLDGFTPQGRHTAVFDGSGLASGVYVVRMMSGGRVMHTTMTMVR